MQLTIRIAEELASRVKVAADAAGKSVNGWVNAVLSAAANPDLQNDELERIRERLRLAGLLFEPPKRARRPSKRAVDEARAAAGRGKPLSEFVTEGRS